MNWKYGNGMIIEKRMCSESRVFSVRVLRMLRGKDLLLVRRCSHLPCLRTQLALADQNGSSMLAERLEKNAQRPRDNPRERTERREQGSRWGVELSRLGGVSLSWERACKSCDDRLYLRLTSVRDPTHMFTFDTLSFPISNTIPQFVFNGLIVSQKCIDLPKRVE